MLAVPGQSHESQFPLLAGDRQLLTGLARLSQRGVTWTNRGSV